MPTTIAPPAQADQARAARRPRSTLPSAPWAELLGFLIFISLLVAHGA